MSSHAKLIAEDTQEAYSFDRYGFEEWANCAAMLLGASLPDREVEAILRSKHMRYAADEAKNPEAPTAEDLAAFMDRYPRHFTQTALNELVEGTFA